ncbi:MAG: response regulator transcription factor [Patescibacteria group bacterium]
MKILLIDDDESIRNFLKSALESECFEVDLAEDGEKGSFLSRTNDYDVIICDYSLPKKNGQQICEEIRKDEKDTPILMLSVEGESQMKADLLNIGADDYLTKPFSLEELLARVRALLRRPNQIKNDILKIDDLIIDTKKHLVKRGEKEIYLTMKEFMLLEYLMRSRGAVQSRAIILEHVWDMNADLFSNTIEAHISNLRRKIDTKGKNKLIHTIPGRGYKIDI